mmetsp:Transcript_61916/g.141795  ORF Transcript_61916/g.141795 Transcript_61916/m.141795 type:complete len:239 (+) Transcript_61916:448-1164(+)
MQGVVGMVTTIRVGHSKRRDGTRISMQSFFGNGLTSSKSHTRRQSGTSIIMRHSVGMVGASRSSHSRRRDGTCSNMQSFFVVVVVCSASHSRRRNGTSRKQSCFGMVETSHVSHSRRQDGTSNIMQLFWGTDGTSSDNHSWLWGGTSNIMQSLLWIVRLSSPSNLGCPGVGGTRRARHRAFRVALWACGRRPDGLVALRGQGSLEHEVVPRVEAADEGPVLEERLTPCYALPFAYKGA